MNERQLLIALAVVCLLVAVGAVGYGAGKARDVPAVIRAQRFELVDGEGKTMAVLEVTELGPQFTLHDEHGDGKVTINGRAYLSVAAAKDSAFLSPTALRLEHRPLLTGDAQDKGRRACLSTGSGWGGLGLALSRDAGHRGFTEGDGWASLGFSEGYPQVRLDSWRKGLVSLGCGNEGPVGAMKDGDGKQVWSVP